MQKENSPRSSFLQKFQGKNQKINRDGLLQMLNGKLSIQSNNNKAKKSLIKQHLQQEQHPSNILKSTSSQKQSSKVAKNIFSSVQLKATKSQRPLDKMAFHLIKQQNDQKGFEYSNQFKLPSINRSKSQNGNIKYALGERDIMQSQITNKKNSKSGSFYQKNSDKLTRKIQLDEYILRHLEFLNKFQKNLINSRQFHHQKTINNY